MREKTQLVEDIQNKKDEKNCGTCNKLKHISEYLKEYHSCKDCRRDYMNRQKEKVQN